MEPDPELEAVEAEIRKLDPLGEKIAKVLRATLDQLYDGENTGHYRWDQLRKTEKTHCGTLVEINLHREFEFEDGAAMDYRIAGADVDCKYSQSRYGWMIPNEADKHLCLLLSANDEESRWSLGIVRIQQEILTAGGNRDAKKTISAEGRKHIKWIFTDATLPPNILLQLPREEVDRIMNMQYGSQRINEIFRIAPGQRIGRGVICTLGQQADNLKRVRDNGGARDTLSKEGIIILGEYNEHKRVAEALGLPVPLEGEFVSVRVAKADAIGDGVVEINGEFWRVAKPEDPPVKAPMVAYA